MVKDGVRILLVCAIFDVSNLLLYFLAGPGATCRWMKRQWKKTYVLELYDLPESGLSLLAASLTLVSQNTTNPGTIVLAIHSGRACNV